MSALGKKLRSLEGGRVAFMCPGCQEMHHVTVDGTRGWKWNGSGDAPTFQPSVLVTGKARFPTDEEQAAILAGEDIELPDRRCHSFVLDGRIRFLPDCTHPMAGLIVDLPDLDINR